MTPYEKELWGSLHELTTWMQEHTGPSDGTLEMLTRAVELLERVEGI